MTDARVGDDGKAAVAKILIMYAGAMRHNRLNTLFLINMSSLFEGLFLIKE
jgi:hypothetical protein